MYARAKQRRRVGQLGDQLIKMARTTMEELETACTGMVGQPAAAWRLSLGMPGGQQQLALPLHHDATMCRDAEGRGVYLGLGHISLH